MGTTVRLASRQVTRRPSSPSHLHCEGHRPDAGGGRRRRRSADSSSGGSRSVVVRDKADITVVVILQDILVALYAHPPSQQIQLLLSQKHFLGGLSPAEKTQPLLFFCSSFFFLSKTFLFFFLCLPPSVTACPSTQGDLYNVPSLSSFPRLQRKKPFFLPFFPSLNSTLSSSCATFFFLGCLFSHFFFPQSQPPPNIRRRSRLARMAEQKKRGWWGKDFFSQKKHPLIGHPQAAFLPRALSQISLFLSVYITGRVSCLWSGVDDDGGRGCFPPITQGGGCSETASVSSLLFFFGEEFRSSR